MADTPTGETVTPGDTQTTVTTPTTPPVDNGSTAEVERLRKEKEQAEMRANQLANTLAEKEKSEAEAERKRLEESEQWKTLAEKNAAELKEVRDTQDREARQKALDTATEVLLKDYPEGVVEVAKTAGLALNEDSEAAKTALKEKLDAIKERVGSGGAVTSNNPASPAPTEVNREELVTKGDNGVSPMAMAGAKGDDSVARKYIGSLPQIEEMRRMAGMNPKQT